VGLSILHRESRKKRTTAFCQALAVMTRITAAAAPISCERSQPDEKQLLVTCIPLLMQNGTCRWLSRNRTIVFVLGLTSNRKYAATTNSSLPYTRRNRGLSKALGICASPPHQLLHTLDSKIKSQDTKDRNTSDRRARSAKSEAKVP
jgi:hypothetical protein